MVRFPRRSRLGARKIVLPWVCAVSLAFGASAAGASSGQGGEFVDCTYASLHAGTCIQPVVDSLVGLIDAVDVSSDRCAAEGRGGGNEYVVCRYDGATWSEFGARRVEMSTALAAGDGDRILDILNPPPESGLVPPVGDGIDGEPNAPRTDDAAAITAAIQYACEHDYDIAYLGPGTYRIGADSPISFYSGIRIEASTCPNGIRFYGAGIGRTVLLANGARGQYIVYTTDAFVDTTKVLRLGWNTSGHTGDTRVTGITTGVTPPVVSASGPSGLEDGDTVHVRNCSGVTQANERTFMVNACTASAPFSCELRDEFGVDVDATDWSAWTDESPCIIQKMNPDFETTIAYMTLRDDAPDEHMNVVCSPLCSVPGEESHGIGILQGGGVVEVHDIVIDTVGDEGIDISAPESPTYIHDVTIVNAANGGTPVYQGKGVRIEDVWVHKDVASPWNDNQFGSTEYPPYGAGDGFAVFVGRHNWRLVDLQVNRMVMTGLLGMGFSVASNATGQPGQYVSGIRVANSVVNLNPNELHCNGPYEVCGSFRIHVKEDGYPIEDIEISNNVMTGTAYLELAKGAGGVVVKDNVLRPIATITPKWGMVAGARSTTIEGNDIAGFERGCIQYQPYPTHDDEHATLTTTIRRNVLECPSTAGNRDALIGVAGGGWPTAADDDEGYFHIFDNDFIVGASSFNRNAVRIMNPYKDVRVCGNRIAFDPAAPTVDPTALVMGSDDQLVCDNTIELFGSGMLVVGDRSKIVGNSIRGFNADFATGIAVVNSSATWVVNNTVENYRRLSSTGIYFKAEQSILSEFWIAGNLVRGAGAGISFDGGGHGFEDVSISGNRVDLSQFSPANAILLRDTTDARVTGNELIGLGGASANALLTTGATDYVTVRDNLAEGGGTFKFGTTGGDESCNPIGGVGSHSTCSDNELR